MARLKNLIEQTDSMDITGPDTSPAIQITGGQVLSLQAVITVIDPLTDASIKLQKSNNGEDWKDEGSATTFTDTGSVFLEKKDPSGLYYRASIALTDGEFTTELKWLVKGIDG